MLTFLSLCCIVGGTLLGLPQAVHLLRSKSSAGLSLLAWQIWFAVVVAWFVHGILISSWTQIIPNAFSIPVTFLILRLVQKDRGLSFMRAFGPALALLVVAVAVRVGLGPVAFGLVMSVPQSIAVLGQFVDLVRCRVLVGVSPVYLLMALVLQGCWVAYGLMLPDVAAFISAVVMVGLNALNLGWWLARRAGLRPLWPTSQPDAT